MEVETQGSKERGALRAPGGPQGTGVTVAVYGRNPEVAVVGQEQWEVIRERHGAGVSVSSIARDLGLDRKTVRRCLKQAVWKPFMLATHCVARMLW